MTCNKMPLKKGLYDPAFEHESCGVGFIVNINGLKSHSIVCQALSVLKSLEHRGATGYDPDSGDGAGILLQIPHDFFIPISKQLNFTLPAKGEYGVGMLFLPNDAISRDEFKKQFKKIVLEEKLSLLGWREVPTNPDVLGIEAKSSMPFIESVFIGKNKHITNELIFERKLYIIRKMAEKMINNLGIDAYISSLSSRTIVYKGMFTANQLGEFYTDLKNPILKTAIALVHSRYSTNTFPSWPLAHPYRYIIHNGEINTLRGNVNWMRARECLISSDELGDDISKILPIIVPNASDSATLDNVLEFLTLSGYSLQHAISMLIPEPWNNHTEMSPEKKAFYEYHSCIMEPWDGPATVAFTDGNVVGAVLDRNGLRPSRYYVTDDDIVILSSEVGVLDIPDHQIKSKGRLYPGRILLIDTKQRKIISDHEVKKTLSSQQPYKNWLDVHMIPLEQLPQHPHEQTMDIKTVSIYQKAFNYTYEELRIMLGSMVKEGIDPVGSMGFDCPLAVLSTKPQLLYNYFKQLFAQVTNPPIDAIREEIITSVETHLGSLGNIINPGPNACKQIKLKTPILDNKQIAKLKNVNSSNFKSVVIPILFEVSKGTKGLETALDNMFQCADKAITVDSANILILSDRGITKQQAAIPALLAVAGLHHYLVREGKRTKVSILLESAEPREVHHFCLLIGYGVSAINPYLAFESLYYMLQNGLLNQTKITDYEHLLNNYIKAATKGIVKVLSKMGISTIQSYRGAQVFEAIGISSSIIDKYFCMTPSRIEGIDLEDIANDILYCHNNAFSSTTSELPNLDSGGVFQCLSDGEQHLLNPEAIYTLQQACKNNDYAMYKKYSNLINEQSCTLRSLMELLPSSKNTTIPLDEVEPVESIYKRFKTGAMSYGSLSQEAHECFAIAMNRLGGKSNTGEGGEDPKRFLSEPNGDSKCSAIKQVASGRFGVTSHYLTNAKEIQIKIAQGAKPGEGGQLPGRKVYPWIAEVRGSTPGVELISPPPHHDIYSIEDLAQLIYDLKNANREAKISVKLVSEAGVGTVAAGVAKGGANSILISGYDGGTGSSPYTSIRHAGIPWELGLSETHQTLVLNNLRDKVTIETDGKLLTGKDVVIAAILGAQEFGFATAPMIVLGCVMVKVCNLDTCPVGIATQNPELRKQFSGSPDHIVNLMRFIAQEVRELMASIGVKTIDELIGNISKIKLRTESLSHKTNKIDLSKILYSQKKHRSSNILPKDPAHSDPNESLDAKTLIKICESAILHKQPVSSNLPIKNTNRSVGTILGNEISKKYGANGLPDDTIHLKFYGSAGQSFGAFVPCGIKLELEGDSNDYVGKGLCGGKIIIYPPSTSSFIPEQNIIIGNVAFYGATKGEAYIRGIAGERFCVRNSGVNAVVEGVGDHGCEYMTGGKVVILGETGRNFAAGMSGGIAYIYSPNQKFYKKCSNEKIVIEHLINFPNELDTVKLMITNHLHYTNSSLACKILNSWEAHCSNFLRVIPLGYKNALKL